MKYVSLDLETTGLDSNLHQIIEIACVIDDLRKPVDIESLGSGNRAHGFSTLVVHENYNFSHWAMKTHLKNGLINELLTRVGQAGQMGPSQAGGWLIQFLTSHSLYEAIQGKRPTVAGKNFARFDAPFLLKLHGFSIGQEWWHHRSLDVGSLYAKATDTELPSTEECLKRAGLKSGGNHRAMDDALDVVRLVRHALLGKI